MQAITENLPWNLRIKARAKHFSFNFKLRLNPTSESLLNLNPHRFSLLLKLRRWRLQLESESGSPLIKTELLKRNRSIKSRFVRIFQKIRSRLRIQRHSGPTAKSAKFAIGKSRLVKCGAFSVVLATAVVASAFGFNATTIIECAMESIPSRIRLGGL